MITEKTGSLIATSGQFGALFAGAPPEIADTIAVACEQLGVAWQLSDDVIDIASEGGSVRQDARARTCARGCGRCPFCTRWGGGPRAPADARLRWLLEEADLTDEALLGARRWGCCAAIA